MLQRYVTSTYRKGRLTFVIQGYLFRSYLPWLDEALTNGHRIVRLLRTPGIHNTTLRTVFEDEFHRETGERYEIKVPAWALLPLADEIEKWLPDLV
jgi:hypothetical protein